jgi:hypothetical protein
MALDLFLVPSKPKPRSKSALLKARQALFESLHATYPDTSLVGNATQGHIANFPLGALHIRPDELHWALHGVVDADPVHALADWFVEHGFDCEDPQGAGFARPRPKPLAAKGSLDDLAGGTWLGFRFDRNYATALDFDFTLVDGRNAVMRFLHFGSCHIPDLSPLVTAIVTEATLRSTSHDETIRVLFEGGHELLIADAVFDGVRIT